MWAQAAATVASATSSGNARALQLKDWGQRMDYKSAQKVSEFTSVAGCSTCMSGTLTICGKCIRGHQLGNIVYGLVAKILSQVQNAALVGRLSFGWDTFPQKASAFYMGVHLELIKGGLPGMTFTAGNFCASMASAQDEAEKVTGVSVCPQESDCSPCATKYNGPHTDPSKNSPLTPGGHVPAP